MLLVERVYWPKLSTYFDISIFKKCSRYSFIVSNTSKSIVLCFK